MGTGADIGPYRIWTFTAPEGTAAGELRELVLRARGWPAPNSRSPWWVPWSTTTRFHLRRRETTAAVHKVRQRRNS